MGVIRKVVLSNGAKFDIKDNASEIEVLYKGLYTKGLCLVVVGSDLDTIQATFGDSTNVNVINEMDEAGEIVINTYEGFTDLYYVGINYVSTEQVYTVTLARPVDYQKAIADLTATQTEIAEKVAVLTATPDPSKMELNEAIEYLANDSKNQLGTYLENHPITSTVHGGVEAKYSITREKQNMLTSMILMTEMAKQSGLEYTPSWNATNEPCTYDWTVEELQTLAVQIESTVRPLISLQQTIESNIRKASTVEEAIAAAVNYEEAVAQGQ